MTEPVRVLKHEGATYVDVSEFIDVIIRDLLKAPPTMVASRDEIIHALRRYSTDAQNAIERDV